MKKTNKPRLLILATGGTIAGIGASPVKGSYRSGQISAEQLLADIPAMDSVVDIVTEQFCNLPSQNVDDNFLISLSGRVNEWLLKDDIDGIIITHGTDTLEETAYFLQLVINSSKPVVLTGSMRPSTATSADGPMNLINAISVAASAKSAGVGVVVVMNETIFGARGVVKSNTTAVNTFTAPNFGPLGQVRDLHVEYHRRSNRIHTIDSELHLDGRNRVLPSVGIVYSHAGHTCLPITAYHEAGFAGVVLAGMGNGNIADAILSRLEHLESEKFRIVRSSRCYSGITGGGEMDDERYGLIAAQDLNPQKARILLQLALLRSTDINRLRYFFEHY